MLFVSSTCCFGSFYLPFHQFYLPFNSSTCSFSVLLDPQPIHEMSAQSLTVVPIMVPYEPIYKGVIIPYHVTPAPRLLSVTFDKLESVGFSRSSFGEHDGAALGKPPGPSTATALLQFTSFTKDLLPSWAGGSNEDAPFTPTKATSTLLSAVSASRSAFGRDIEAESDAGLLFNLRAASAEFNASSPGRARGDDGVSRLSTPSSSHSRSVEESEGGTGASPTASSAERGPDTEQLSRVLQSLSASLLDMSARSKSSPKTSPTTRVSPSSASSPVLPTASDEQRHLVAAQQSTLLRSSAQAYLSELGAAFPLIQKACHRVHWASQAPSEGGFVGFPDLGSHGGGIGYGAAAGGAADPAHVGSDGLLARGCTGHQGSRSVGRWVRSPCLTSHQGRPGSDCSVS